MRLKKSGVKGTGYLWGGKGFDYQTMKFADAETITSGYTYYDPNTRANKIGKGVDCSGLVFWSFNKAYGATKYKDTSNPVYYEGAAGQWSDSSRFRQKSTSVPSKDNLAVGDLLFIGTVNTNSPDHVGIYIGNGNVIHAKGSATIEIKTLDGWLNLPVDSTRRYRDCFTGYGSVITSEPPESVTFSRGDSVEVQNTNPLGLKVRDSPAGDKTGNVYDGARGTILDGPQSAFLEGLTYTWWEVQWDDGQVGWSAERYPVSGGVYYFKKVIPTTGSIAITTTQTGASVYLDGVYQGTTPVTLHLVSAGTHTVKLTLSGYEDYEESVRVYAGQTAYITPTMQPVPTTGSISIQPQSSTLAVGQTQAFTIVLNATPDGLSGFNATISLIDPPAHWQPSPLPPADDPYPGPRGDGPSPLPPADDPYPGPRGDGPSPDPDPRDDGPTSIGSPVAELIGVTYPQWAKLPMNSSFPSDSVFIQAVDIERSVEPGETNVTLFTIIVRGDAPGTALLRVNVTNIEDDIGGWVAPAATDATLIVHDILPFPNPAGGTFPAPTDLDGDGLYEDLDGNGFVGFNDVVIYYQNMEFIESNQPLMAFDCDGSGFIGFNDVVYLYRMV